MLNSESKGNDMNNKNLSEHNSLYSEINELSKRIAPKKIDSIKLSEIYANLGEISRSVRVKSCGDILEFSHEFDINTGTISEKGRLTHANFCRDTLCPMCQWRKSLKTVSMFSKVLQHPEVNGNFKYIMITLTIPNVKYSELDNGIDKLFYGFDKLMHQKRYKKTVLGYYRSLEITINKRSKTFHPHLHVMLLVDKSYSPKSSLYINHDMLLSDWRNACQDQSITQVDIRLAYDKRHKDGTIENAALEMSKYAAKVGKTELEEEIIFYLLKGLSHRRTTSYGGVLKDIFRRLKIEDLEFEDLVHINDEVPSPIMNMIIRYGWTASGYQILSSRLEGSYEFEFSKVC